MTEYYIPKTIHVGFTKRSDTYTGKLGFLTYIDDKGVLRQEKSWNDWRSKEIEPLVINNEPSRFIFNKDINRSGHWSNVTKVRIYDVCDFEFEIDVSNMMYILMHSDISKRDIMQECVFAWKGRNVYLIPTNSHEYLTSVEHTRKIETKFSNKDLVPGFTYSVKNSKDEYIYLGNLEYLKRFDRDKIYTLSKEHVFLVKYKNFPKEDNFVSLDSKNIVEAITDSVHPQYSEYIEKYQKYFDVRKEFSFKIYNSKNTDGNILYKNVGYNTFQRVILDEKTKSYLVEELALSSNSSLKFFFKKQTHYYLDQEFLRKMRKNNINQNDFEQVKKFFIDNKLENLYIIDYNKNKQSLNDLIIQ